tara:strand:+ start:1782 stop:1895 length:114 start_codon:yes stop_codon:yes gene_type:complete
VTLHRPGKLSILYEPIAAMVEKQGRRLMLADRDGERI